MVTQNIYTSMVGKHFKELEVKLYCALIDQRIEYQLPSYMIRKRLVELIHSINRNKGINEEKQNKAESKIMRDLQAYPQSKEENFNFSVILKTGAYCKIDLLHDEISYSDVRGNIKISPISYGTQWKNHTYIRYISTNNLNELDPLATPDSPVICIENISSAYNQAVLELLMTVTDLEKGIHEEKICPSCGYSKSAPKPGSSFALASGDIVESPPHRKYQRKVAMTPTMPLKKLVQYECEKCQNVFYM